MSNQKKIIKLTRLNNEPVLIGVESIIGTSEVINNNTLYTKIESRGAMISTFWVTESTECIWQMINE
jgi:hypothetical protein